MQYKDAPEELGKLALALLEERKAEEEAHRKQLLEHSPKERRKNGWSWFPLKVEEFGYTPSGSTFLVLVPRGHDEVPELFTRGTPVTAYKLQDREEDRENISAVILSDDADQIRIGLHLEELPNQLREGDWGLDLAFDSRSFDEMMRALNVAINLDEGIAQHVRDVILGYAPRKVSSARVGPKLNLNQSQNEAVVSIVNSEEIAAVHGPPGTGKTTTLVSAIQELIKEEQRVLVCAPSNAAVDHMTRELAKKEVKVVRMGHTSRVDADNLDRSLDQLMLDDKGYKQVRNYRKRAAELRKKAGTFKRSFGHEERAERRAMYQEARSFNQLARDEEDHLVQRILDEADVVACTLVGAGNRRLWKMHFDVVVIDEAAQALEPALWIAILKADKVVLAGDPFQLPAVIKDRKAGEMGLDEGLLSKVIQRTDAATLLTTQYRMNHVIMGFSNDYFYEGKLKAAPAVELHTLTPDEPALEFIDTAGCDYEEKQGEESNSKFNPEEAALVKRHLAQLRERVPAGFSLGVIAPYRAQVELLKQSLDPHPDMVIQTVDGFQGQERDVMYISLTRSNEQGEIGFLADYRRMNVAMTRARKKLVVIGDSATLGSDPFYTAFLEYCEKHEAYDSAWSFIS